MKRPPRAIGGLPRSSCRRAFPHLAAASSSGGFGLGCLMLLALLLIGGIIVYVVSECDGPW